MNCDRRLHSQPRNAPVEQWEISLRIQVIFPENEAFCSRNCWCPINRWTGFYWNHDSNKKNKSFLPGNWLLNVVQTTMRACYWSFCHFADEMGKGEEKKKQPKKERGVSSFPRQCPALICFLLQKIFQKWEASIAVQHTPMPLFKGRIAQHKQKLQSCKRLLPWKFISIQHQNLLTLRAAMWWAISPLCIHSNYTKGQQHTRAYWSLQTWRQVSWNLWLFPTDLTNAARRSAFLKQAVAIPQKDVRDFMTYDLCEMGNWNLAHDKRRIV